MNVPRETLISSDVMHTNHRQIPPSTASTRELFDLDSANDPQSTVRTLGVVSTAARRVDRQPARHGAHAGPTDAALFCVCAARSHPTSASDVETARYSPLRITEELGCPRPLRAISGCGWLVVERVQPSCTPCSCVFRLAESPDRDAHIANGVDAGPLQRSRVPCPISDRERQAHDSSCFT